MHTLNIAEVLAAHTYQQIDDLQQQIADLRAQGPSARTADLIEMRELRIKELLACAEIGDEMAEAEVVEICTVEQQLAEAVSLLSAAHPRTRWFTQHGVLMGVVGIDIVRIERSGRGWSGWVQGPWIVTYEYGEEPLIWCRASGAELVQLTSLLATRAQVVRAEGLDLSEVAA
jgi:hypothetical protein